MTTTTMDRFRRLLGLFFILNHVCSETIHCRIEPDGRQVCQDASELTNENTSGVSGGDEHLDASSCGLYIAPSTIPNAGLGIFTAKRLEKDEEIDMIDVAVPLVDMKAHWFFTELDSSNQDVDSNLDVLNKEYAFSDPSWFFPFEAYIWQGWAIGMERETHPMINDIEAFCPGVDAAINSHLALNNIGGSTIGYELHNVTADEHHTAGSFSPYTLGHSKAQFEIPAGGELFKSYGDNWFIHRSDKFGPIPLMEDYTRAQQALRRFVESTEDLSTDARRDLWELIVEKLRPNLPTSRYLNAFPAALEDAELIGEEGVRAYFQPNATRSLEDLQLTGRCVDHIYPNTSTIPHAGMGAFARHSLKQGEVISASPLLHQPNRDIMRVYPLTINLKTGNVRRLTNDVYELTEQLVVNYCYSHAETTLLLCPYGLGVNYINHNQTQANVRLQWAQDKFLGHNSTWLREPVSHMHNNSKVSLIMEYVAIRDIQKGEELFLDYGDAFEAALQQHQQDWTPPERPQSHAPHATSHVWNSVLKDAPLRTYFEQDYDPYPPNLELHCHPDIFGTSLGGDYDEYFSALSFDLNQRGVLCWVTERYWSDETKEYLYTVEAEHYDQEDRFIYQTNVRREQIVFGDKPYSTDIHLPGAFRHPIHLPDDMFPEAWKNAKK